MLLATNNANNSTSSHQVIDESTSYTIIVSSTLPNVVFVKLLGWKEIIESEVTLGIVGIHPILERNVTIQLPNQSFIVSIEQILLVLALALTINKCQRLTMPMAILGPLLHPLWQTPKRMESYI
jgi:hypothetical protein